jgi:hypothetical protein
MDKKTEQQEECFVIMPISDCAEYPEGHFKRVYEDIFAPAIKEMGYSPRRADETKSSDLIQLDIIKRLVSSPMAICDLSTRNPNVMFELGIRQAFDKPVVLVKEIGTPNIFDIAQIRYVEYRKTLLYNEVLEDQKNIRNALEATKEQTTPNSIIRLLELGEGAKFNNTSSKNGNNILEFLMNELKGLRKEIRDNNMSNSQLLSKPILIRNNERTNDSFGISNYERPESNEMICNKLQKLTYQINSCIDTDEQVKDSCFEDVIALMRRFEEQRDSEGYSQCRILMKKLKEYYQVRGFKSKFFSSI